MYKSELQMVGNPQITKFNFEKLGDYKKTIDFEIKINNLIKDETETGCKIVQFLNIFSKDELTPFEAQITAEALYTWNKDIKKENKEMFIKYSAPSIILSYIRPIITQVLIYSGLPDFRLPMINMFNVVNEQEIKK